MNFKLKKTISLILTFVMVAGLFTTVWAGSARAEDACGYSPAMSFSELDLKGEEAVSGESYSISTADELSKLASYINSGKNTSSVTFYLTGDISVGSLTWVPLGDTAEHAFKGVFDGCGYAINKLSVTEAKDNAAVFGFVGEGAVIKNLGVQGSVTGGVNTAGIVANLDSATVANCFASVDLSGTENVGGIAANVTKGTIENCLNYRSVKGESSVGAIAGTLNGQSTVNYCYYVYYSADRAIGSSTAESTQAVYRFSTSSAEVLTEKDIKVDSKETDDLITLLNDWVSLHKDTNYRTWVYDTSTKIKNRIGGRYPSMEYPDYIAPVVSYYTATATMTALRDSKQNAVDGGCYSISSTDELHDFRDYVNEGFKTDNVTFFLDKDIFVAKGVDSWIPIGKDKDLAFNGVFDGQGYVLTDILIDGRSNGLGLFGYLNNANATVKNVGLFGKIDGGDNCGGIVGELLQGTVANCWFDGQMQAKDRSGGIVGKAEAGQILNCVDFAKVTGDKRVGGIVGASENSTTIKYCYYTKDNAQACGETAGSQTAVVAFSKDGSDFTLEKTVVVGSAAGVKLLNVLNNWVSYLANDQSYRLWKIDDSASGIARIQGNHPTHLFPGDNAGVKRVDEPHVDVDASKNPYNIKYNETSTMTALYEAQTDAVAGANYSISTAQELKLLAQFVNEQHSTKDATFYLTKDLDISVKVLGNDSEGWMPIGSDHHLTDTDTYKNIFQGTFDGCGYTVTGLYIYNERGDNLGLFGRINHATIKNVGVVGAVVGEYDCGGIVGKANNSVIRNCWTSVSFQAESETGGIAGRATDTTIENCVTYGTGIIVGGDKNAVYGGIAGDILSNCVVKNCFYLDKIASNGYSDLAASATVDITPFSYGFVNDDYYCTLKTPVTVDDVTTTSLLDALNAWVLYQNSGAYCGWYNSVTLIGGEDNTGHYPRLMSAKEFTDSDYNEDYKGDYVATSSVTQLLATGADAKNGGFYAINGLDDLEALQKYVAAGRKTDGVIFFMTRDLDMSAKYHADGNSWKPIGDKENSFKGTFDGQGYTVKYIFIDSPADDIGLFGHTSRGALIKNLGICGVIKGNFNVGSIVGDCNGTTVVNCWSSCQVTAIDGNAGGIVGGANLGAITNCTSYGVITSTDAYGAICGIATGTKISYCYYLYGTCQQAYSKGSTAIPNGVQYFNGTSSACILHEKINVEGTETRNALSALKLYVDAHPETNYCYWVIGNNAEYVKMGIGLFPVLLSASGTMGERDYAEVQAYFNGEEYYSVVKAINAANDSENGGTVTLATNVVLYQNDNVTINGNVTLATDKYSAIIKSHVKLKSMQQLDGYFTVKDGGKISMYDMEKNDFALFMYSQKKADPSCNSPIYGNDALTFRSSFVSDDNPDAYNLSLQSGEFMINSSLDSGNPHGIPGGSTITIESRATLNVISNARIRTTGGARIYNEGTVKIGNATLDRNTGVKMCGVFEDDGGTVTLPYIYKDGYTLRGWSDGKNLYPAGSKADIQQATTLTAQWSLGSPERDPYPGDDAFAEDKPVYDIPITVIQSAGGKISPENRMAAKGENITIQVLPDSGYFTKTVLIDNEPVTLDENNCYTLVSVSREHTVIAFFAKSTNKGYYDWTNPYSDVSDKEWYFDSIKYVSSAGLFNGVSDDTFAPDEVTTREMLVTVLWRLAGSPVVPESAGIGFNDVPKGSYAYDAIRWASMFKIVEGYGDGSFGYGDPMLREQLVAIIYRFAKNYVGLDVSAFDSANIIEYSDFLQISHGMAQPFQWAVGAKVIFGTSKTTLEPQGLATRAQVAAVLQRMCTNFIDTVPVVKV